MTTQLPKPTDLILVAFMPTPRDMEIARVLGWYRIPLQTAPKILSVDYLAFYQPASFKAGKWQIEMVAPVQGHELVTRAELLKEEVASSKAREEYFKIQIGSLIQLPSPIRADQWKRITFFYTTGEYLIQAETIRDLVVHTHERKLLWQSLRERATSEQIYDIPDMDVPPEILLTLLGIKELTADYEG